MQKIIVLFVAIYAVTTAGGELFVSPTGDDAAGGMFAPLFATLARVAEVPRRSCMTMQCPDLHYASRWPVFPGRAGHLLAARFRNGRRSADDRAYPNEKPVISGGRLVSGWKAVQVGNRQLWSATVDAVVPSIRQIWVNGQFRHVTRHPNSSYLHVAALPDAMPEWDQGQTRFNYREGDLFSSDLGPHACVVTMTRWAKSHLPIASIDRRNIFSTSRFATRFAST